MFDDEYDEITHCERLSHLFRLQHNGRVSLVYDLLTTDRRHPNLPGTIQPPRPLQISPSSFQATPLDFEE